MAHELYIGAWEAGLGLGLGIEAVALGGVSMSGDGEERAGLAGLPEDGEVDAHEAVEDADVAVDLGAAVVGVEACAAQADVT